MKRSFATLRMKALKSFNAFIFLLQNAYFNDTLYVMHARKSGVTYEVRLTTDPSQIGSIELLNEALLSLGVSQQSLVQCAQWPTTELSVFFCSKNKAYALKRKVRALDLEDVNVSVKQLLNKQWQTKWKTGFKPFALTKTFSVIPKNYKGKHHDNKRTPIYIDTDLAFGTGLHATTRFMAQFIERVRGQYESFLDVGTGTGILSIIASKCGARKIQAVDISRSAVKVAKDNFHKNGCDHIQARAADAYKLKGKSKYDFVCANIITYDLIELGQILIDLVKPGQYLAISGISLKSYPLLRRAYARYPLRCLKIEKGEGWAAVLFKKKN